jgi:uncharacterized protein
LVSAELEKAFYEGKLLMKFCPETRRQTLFILIKKNMNLMSIQNYHHLIEYVRSRQKEGMNYLFIDEVQEIKEFEKTLRSLLSETNFDIYCTGSNAKMLSGEIATILSGRQITFKIYSLSFIEFCQFNRLEMNLQTLNSFLKYGGLPYLMHLPKQDEIIFEYLRNIYSTILFRDIVSRNEIRDVAFLNNLLRFIADNTGSLVSAKKISDYLKSQQSSKTVSVILNYIAYLEEAYFLLKVKRKDIQGKKIFEVNEKYYFEDFGLRNSVNGFKISDIGKIAENAVYQHLLICGYDIFVGEVR